MNKYKKKMSGILYLNANDFIIKKGDKGNLLCMSAILKGMSLVLFYSNECEHCNKLITKYKQLPLNINGCQFAMININKPENQRIIVMSNNTIAPITFVPDIILYVDGIPYIRYDGMHDIDKMREFIVDIYQKLQKTVFQDNKKDEDPAPKPPQIQQQQRPMTKNKMPEKQEIIPAYTIGRPKCNSDRDDVCYLSFTKAYDQENGSVHSVNNNNHEQNNHLFLRNQNPTTLQRPISSQF